MTSDDLARAEHRARTSGESGQGTLSEDVLRLLAERLRLLALLAQAD